MEPAPEAQARAQADVAAVVARVPVAAVDDNFLLSFATKKAGDFTLFLNIKIRDFWAKCPLLELVAE